MVCYFQNCLNKLFAGFVVLSYLFIAGCQSSPDFLTEFEAAIGPSSSTYGTGDFPVGVLLSQGNNNGAQDYLDGIKISSDLLGQGAFQLVIHRTNGTMESTQAAMADFLSAGVKFILGPVDSVDLAALPDDLSIPTVAFLDAISVPERSNSFSFLSDPIDGVNEAIRASVESGHGEIIVLRSSKTSAEDKSRVENYIRSINAKLVGSYRYNGRVGRTFSSVRRYQNAIKSANVIVVLGADVEVKALLDTFLANNMRSDGSVIIELSSMAALDFKDPAYDSVIYGSLRAPSAALIQEQFQLKYTRPPNQQATYGFDAMAMLAGLQRSGQMSGDIANVLRNPAGFKALNGHFRFRADGSVERRHEIYQVKDQEPVLIQEIGTGF